MKRSPIVFRMRKASSHELSIIRASLRQTRLACRRLTARIRRSAVLAEAADHIKVAQFGKEKFLLYLPLYVAMEAGYFEKEGLNIELVFAGNDDQVFAAVASGSVNFGMGDPVFAAIAQERGLHAKVIALLIQRAFLSGFTARKDIPEITSPSQLKDLKIGSFPRPSTTYTLVDKLLRENAGTVGNASIVEGTMGTFAAMAKAGAIDLALDLEPAVSIAESQGMRVVLDFSRFFEEQAFTGLTAREDYLNAHPEIARRMLRAIQNALSLIEGDGAKISDIAAGLFPSVPREVMTKAVKRLRAQHIYPSHPLVEPEIWQRTLQIRLESGDLKHPQSTETAVDNRFAIEAAKEKASKEKI